MSSEGFDELYNVIDKSLIPSGKYYSAHRNEEILELLEDHMDLCTRYFLHIVKELDIEPIFDNLIDLIFKDKQQVKKIILYAIYYHDIGKLNPNFQSGRVHGEKIEGDMEHSFFSEQILTSFLIKKFPEYKGMIYLVTNVVLRHHSRLKNFSREDEVISREQIKLIKGLSELTGIDKEILHRFDKKYFFRRDIDKGHWPKVFIFVKLLYSLLVLSDSYSTVHFQYSLKNMYPLNTLTKPIRAKMFESYHKISYNKDIDSMKPQDMCNTINDLRRNILIECNKNIKDLLKRDNKIFMLSVPTGGGKTNISMKIALDILEYDEKIKRIFYVFPYINIIEQNYDAINKTLFNDDFFDDKVGVISDIYSRAYFDKFHENEEDVSFLKKLMVVSDDDFLNNGVNVITNVNFFNSIIKNASNNRYKIANLCNSVVIIDEVQTLNDKTLRVFYDFIKETSQALNIYYIVMSATLPDFNDFLDDVDVPQIVENPGKYFTHRLLKRNKIIFRLDVHDIEGIKGLLLDEINQNYRTGNVKILVTLNLVDTSRRTYESLKEDENFKGFIFYLLNSTISSLRRKKIIEEIKGLSKDRVIIVSTQSIEAGMDIDCDFGIRDYAVLDSIEQISGRINRECDREKSDISKLFVIKYKVGNMPDCKKIYRNERFKILTNKFNSDEIKEILENKDFNRYYRVLSESLQKPAMDFFNSTHSDIMNLHYQNINNDLNVIDNNMEKLDIFVCDEIPLDVLSKYDQDKITSLVNSYDMKSFKKDYPIISDNMIITENIYKVWKQIMCSTDKFRDAYIRRKITSLLNQFIISINNIKDGGQDMLSYLMSEGFVELDEDFNFILSTKKFLNCCSFKDGVMLNKLKNMMKQVSGVVI